MFLQELFLLFLLFLHFVPDVLFVVLRPDAVVSVPAAPVSLQWFSALAVPTAVLTAAELPDAVASGVWSSALAVFLPAALLQTLAVLLSHFELDVRSQVFS